MSNRALNHGIDALSMSAIVATFAGFLPPLAGLLGIGWYCIQIWESKTVQKHVRVWKLKARARRLAGLKAEAKDLTARIANVAADETVQSS